MTDKNSPVLAAPRISEYQFASILAVKPSGAYLDAYTIWPQLIAAGIDPSFALAHFHVESLMGTAGHALVTKSWGNTLYPNSDPTAPKSYVPYAPGNGYTYSSFPSWTLGVKDYVWRVLEDVRTGYTSIYEITAYWIGKKPGSAGHLSYVKIVLERMAIYDAWAKKSGEALINAEGTACTGTQRLALKKGTLMYYDLVDKTHPYTGSGTTVTCLGFVQDTTWARIAVTTAIPFPGDTAHRSIVYLKNVARPASLDNNIIASAQRLRLVVGQPVYRAPGDDLPWFNWVNANSTSARYLGRVMNSGWVAFVIQTTRGSSDGKPKTVVVFSPSIPDSRIESAA